eukprot:1184979-Rhodomonas_salina.1
MGLLGSESVSSRNRGLVESQDRKQTRESPGRPSSSSPALSDSSLSLARVRLVEARGCASESSRKLLTQPLDTQRQRAQCREL